MSVTKTTYYGGDVVMLLPNKITQYMGDVVMFLPNKIIKNKKNELSAKKNVGSAHGCKVLQPCARPPKQPMV